MSSGELLTASTFLSYVLRHESQAVGLVLDSEGQGSVETLISGAAKQGRTLTLNPIQQVGRYP